MAAGQKADSLETVRRKYSEERDRRLENGSRQYLSMTEEFAHYEEDPRARQVQRERIDEDCEVLIVGAGHAGLLTGAEIRKAGFTGLIRFVDTAGNFGGNWYWNQYPGAECDTESYIYMPLLEETGYIPSKKYANAAEILEHTQRIARHYGFYEGAIFQTAVTSVEWDESLARWRVRTNRDDELRARYAVLARGIGLTTPRLPDIPGIADFQGHSFHTGRWDFAYTGGDNSGNLHRLRDKRVAIVGTGASSVQSIPHLGKAAKQLYVFQRTPSSVDVRANRPTDADFGASLKPGWQWDRMENFSLFTTGHIPGTEPTAIFSVMPQHGMPKDLIVDGWTEIPRAVMAVENRSSLSRDEMAEIVEQADLEKMNRVRNRVSDMVKDPTVADALKPYYRFWCKRPCFHDEYLATFNGPNVTLVDTAGKGVERITAHGVVANGREYEVDLIVFGSGYDPYGTQLPVTGRDGVTLAEKWSDGVSTLFGVQTAGFPNCFMVQPTQTGGSANVTHILWVQARQIGRVVGQAVARGSQTVEVKESAEREWVDTIVRTSAADANFLRDCTPGNFNSEGTAELEARKRVGAYGPGIVAFTALLDRWYEAGTFEGLEFRDHPTEPTPAT